MYKTCTKPAGLSEATAGVFDATALIAAMLLLWIGCAVILWYAYDMSALVADGAYSRSYALSSAVKFGFILSALIVAVGCVAEKESPEFVLGKSHGQSGGKPPLFSFCMHSSLSHADKRGRRSGA